MIRPNTMAGNAQRPEGANMTWKPIRGPGCPNSLSRVLHETKETLSHISKRKDIKDRINLSLKGQ